MQMQNKAKDLYFCFDMGGTEIKGALIKADNSIIAKFKINTQNALDKMPLAEVLAECMQEICKRQNIKMKDIAGIGVGVPGWVDSKYGEILFLPNVCIKNYSLKEKLSLLTGVTDIRIYNDAFVATLAEKNLGAGRKYKDFIMLTIGTGIGGGLVLDGKIREHSCEVGHVKLTSNQNLCGCGEIGCYETVASTKALVNMVQGVMQKDKNSSLWQCFDMENVNGKAIFDNINNPCVKEIVSEYIKYVGEGIVDLCNVLDPEAVIIGGGISAQKDNFIIPLQKYVNEHAFVRTIGKQISVVQAELINDAGILGAKQLFELNK